MREGRSRLGRGTAVFAVTGACVLAAAPAALGGSLYDGPGPRPGPDILYAAPATAPQLTNAAPWSAEPILISGASAYRGGEFLYQDWIYDDHGARVERGLRDQNDPRTSDDTFSSPNGTYTYPRDPAYVNNAADLVELRVKPLAGETAFRLTLNSMTDPDLVAATLAIGDSAESRELPHGANVRAPAELFLTVREGGAELRDAASGQVLGPAPSVAIDVARRQIDVRVPHAAWNPGEATVRLAAGVGLWDADAGRYLVPQGDSDQDSPGGARGLEDPAAFFNVAFRHAEPWPDATDLVHNADPAWWRDRLQAHELTDGDLSAFSADVDFAKLAAAADDDLHGSPEGVPRTGHMNRILASRFSFGQGLDPAGGCGGSASCEGILRGNLQPYAVYVPEREPPPGGFGLTLLLHALGASYNEFAGMNHPAQLGEAGEGSIVITPSGRGQDGWYYDAAAADAFETWADIARRHELNPDRAAISGYSMGGYGTFKLATQYPDLFARAHTIVGPPALGIWAPPLPPSSGDSTNTNRMLASLRNLPLLMWASTADELVPFTGTQLQARTIDGLGYRYEFDAFAPAEHFTFAYNDEYAPSAEFLAQGTVERNPARVTYVVNPKMDFPDSGTVADHAYWLSGLRLRDASGAAPLGRVDAVSEAFGKGDPVATPTQLGAGVLTGGTLPAIPYNRQWREWGAAPDAPVADVLRLSARNLSHVTVHPGRAGLTCSAGLQVDTDGPVTVELAGCGRSETFGG